MRRTAHGASEKNDRHASQDTRDRLGAIAQGSSGASSGGSAPTSDASAIDDGSDWGVAANAHVGANAHEFADDIAENDSMNFTSFTSGAIGMSSDRASARESREPSTIGGDGTLSITPDTPADVEWRTRTGPLDCGDGGPFAAEDGAGAFVFERAFFFVLKCDRTSARGG